jgi:hypothetical protein
LDEVSAAGSPAIQIGSGPWRLWRPFVLRGAGFPASGVRELSTPGLARAADAVLRGGGTARDREQMTRAWAEAVAATRAAISDIATSPRFREALTWQNPSLLDDAISPLLRLYQQDRRRAKQRQFERLVASYWQRYCVKNDTIGFFGPFSWGRIQDTPWVRLRAGDLIGQRHAYLEPWAVAVLAETVNRDGALDEWLPLYRLPYLRLAQHQVTVAGQPPVLVDPVTSRLLACADGITTAQQAVRRVLAEYPRASEGEIRAALRHLRGLRWVSCRFTVGSGAGALEELHHQLTSMPAGQADEALAMVASVEHALAAVRETGTDAGRLRTALSGLEQVFSTTTDTSVARRAGRMYAGRTLAVMDCVRDADLVLGTDFVAAIAPVELLLTAARWVTWQIRAGLVPQLRAAYDRLRQRGDGDVDLASLWLECLPLVTTKLGPLIDKVADEARRRWADILALPPGAHRVVYPAAELRDRIADAFAAPRSGWSEARYCSPDFMIAAADVSAINRGDYQLILGELHIGINSTDYQTLVGMAPRASELYRCLDNDFPQPRLLLAIPLQTARRYTPRTHRGLLRPQDNVVVLSPNALPSRGRMRAGGDLRVRAAGDTLYVDAGHGQTYEAIDIFAEPINEALDVTFFRGPHVPRITVDRLVIAREQWQVELDEIVGLGQGSDAERFTAVRGWWTGRGLPAQVFVRSPLETKPVYIDAESLAYVEIFAALIRQLRAHGLGAGSAPALTITEMLPSDAMTWLTDRAGTRYTSELRVVAFDTTWPGEFPAALYPLRRRDK